MESMLARVYEEFAVVENCTKANVAVLGRVDRDMPVFLVSALRPKYLGVLRVFLNLSPQILDLFLVVVQAVAQVLLHVTHFSLLRKQVKQVFNFEDVVLTDDSECLLHFDLLARRVRHFRPEKVLCDLHPELLTSLATRRFVGIVACHIRIIDLKSFLDGFGVQVQDAVQDDLRLLNHVDLRNEMQLVRLVLSFLFLGHKRFNLTLADIDSIVDFKEYWLALGLVCFFSLQMLNQIIQILALDEHIEGHVVHSLRRRPLELDAVLGEVVSGLFIGPSWDLVQGRHERLERYVAETVRP